MNIALLPLQIAKKKPMQPAGTGDTGIGPEDRSERALWQCHMEIEPTLMVSDFDTDKSAVFPFLLPVIFIQIRNKTFICRQNSPSFFVYSMVAYAEKKKDMMAG